MTPRSPASPLSADVAGQLALRDEQFRMLLAASGMSVFRRTLPEGVDAPNIGYENLEGWAVLHPPLYGNAPDEPITMAEVVQRILPEDRPQLIDGLNRAVAGKDTRWCCEYRVRRPDGAVRWLRATAVIVRDTRGRAVQVDGVAYDVTAEKSTAAELAYWREN